jgi:phosphoribosyl 1,2-cyclic phosphate phosphodiesterase
MVRVGSATLVIDCGPDFRQQMLREEVSSLDAILITHEHNDHVIGLDDVRPFNFLQRRDMPVFATPRVALELRQRFAYAFSHEPYPGAPMINLEPIANNEPFFAAGIPIIPVEVMHGSLPVLGFRIGDFTYLTDVRAMSEEEIDKIKGCHTLILNALHHEPHYTHLNLEQALELIEIINPQRAFLTHMSHHMGRHAAVSELLPPNVFLGYDGLTFLVP